MPQQRLRGQPVLCCRPPRMKSLNGLRDFDVAFLVATLGKLELLLASQGVYQLQSAHEMVTPAFWERMSLVKTDVSAALSPT